MKLQIKNIIRETDDALSLSFKNGNIFKKLSYKPGQFLTIHVPIDNVVHKRAYSFSSNPYTDKDLKITIKRVEKGLVSNYIHDHIKVGDTLETDKPGGSFYIEPNKTSQKQYVLFAGGSGITPIYSIAESVLVNEPNSKVLLVYANRDIESIIFKNEIMAIENKYPDNFHVEHIVSSLNKNDNNYHSGLATKELIDEIFLKHGLFYGDYVYMICGPFGYMEKVKEILRDNGISREKIKIEVFKSPIVKMFGKDLISDVTIKLGGKIHQIKVRGDKSILQQAMSDNIVLPYSCRAGMCSTCKATCVSGDIKMIEGHFLSEEDIAKGHILTCISYPESEAVVLEF
ncbi:ferredoxin--NADP reductase [Confluentibacter flavum]|uniref:Nitric oxide dioxygenase n=1 Tax=Confluentibacter flavum TaxID=1909700 RepID=A0A2N3HMV1_9FLAO|nr:ferredoxin--NADP reductase [Confluentibacter flavum]PKQ46255.1 nitric oxide dioxygenase [Confluentibacter flavum]